MKNECNWWCDVSIRISHAALDPDQVSALLQATPQIAYRPGESKIPHGGSNSAGYWCHSQRFDAPQRPNVSIEWAEQFVDSRALHLNDLLAQGAHIDVYIGVFSNVLALGFYLPPTPNIARLGIALGIEFFSS